MFSKIGKWLADRPQFALGVFCMINCLNYLDRGIVPGAEKQIENYIRSNLDVVQADSYLGLLSSVFIAGYGIASVVAGHAVHRVPPFRLVSVGLCIWMGAAIAAACAPSYWLLLVARAVSGVGEATFQCVIPPWIDDHAPPDKRSIWLAAFYIFIPTGTALGFIWGSTLATAFSWRVPLFAEAIPMLPLALICWWFPSEPRHAAEERHGQRESLWEEVKVITSRPVWACMALGYASFTFVTSGFAAFGPKMFLDMHVFSKETTASLVFGVVIALAGLISTPLGGHLLDLDTRRQQQLLAHAQGDSASGTAVPLLTAAHASADVELVDSRSSLADMDDPLLDKSGMSRDEQREHECLVLEEDAKLLASTKQCVFMVVLGSVIVSLTPLVMPKLAASIATIGVGCFLLFSTSAAVTVAVMSSVPAENRPLAIGLSTIIQHALGDVPAPYIIGLVADQLSPEHKAADGTYERPQAGLKLTLLLLCLWLIWAILFWLAAAVFARRRVSQHAKLGVHARAGAMLDNKQAIDL